MVLYSSNNRYQIIADVHIPLERWLRSAGVYTSPFQLEDHPWWTLVRLHHVDDQRRDIGSLSGEEMYKTRDTCRVCICHSPKLGGFAKLLRLSKQKHTLTSQLVYQAQCEDTPPLACDTSTCLEPIS